jgi:glucosamine-6-phosphate deaminase
MTSQIETKKLFEFCKIPPEELVNHPESKVKLHVYEKKQDANAFVGNLMADEVIQNNINGKPTRWVLPAGPMEQYETFINRVNMERIDLKNVHVFHMDDFLTWEGRPLPLDHRYSLEGRMRQKFYGLIDPALKMPDEQIHWPRVNDLDALDNAVEAVGGLDTVYAGMGFTGLIAFNEAPRSPWYSISLEEYAQSKTRIFALNDDTMIALAVRGRGGLTHAIPPMAISIGFKAMLNSQRMVILSTTGSWKRTAIRMLMFSEPTLEYPATLFTAKVPEVLLVTDPNTIASPLPEDW